MKNNAPSVLVVTSPGAVSVAVTPVLAELEAFAPLTSKDSYCVVFDTVIEDLPDDMYPDRPWGVGNNPKTAVWTFLKTHSEFEIDKSIDHRSLITVAPGGFLRRIR